MPDYDADRVGAGSQWSADDFDVERFLSMIGKGRTSKDYPRKSTIFLQGDLADSLFYIQVGDVALKVINHEGKEVVISNLKTGDFFGEGSLSGQPKRIASAVATSDCRVMRLEKQHVIEVLRDQPEFTSLFITHLLSRNVSTEEALIVQIFNHLEQKLARALLRWANFGKEGWDPVIAKPGPELTHEALAQMIGASRPKVTQCMIKFRDLGLIDYNDGLEVHSSLLSVVLRD